VLILIKEKNMNIFLLILVKCIFVCDMFDVFMIRCNPHKMKPGTIYIFLLYHNSCN